MEQLFLQDRVAIIWDFDRTLIPGYMQEPLFEHYGVSQLEFWDEVNNLPKFYESCGLDLISKDTLYLNHVLTYVRQGRFKGLSNRLLRDLGSKIQFFEGLPEFFETVKTTVAGNLQFKRHEIELEHYVISTGLRQMVLGSSIAKFLDGVWGCEFVDVVAEPGFLKKSQGALFDAHHTRDICDIGYVIDNTSKTRAVFEINKGSNKLDIDVNAKVDRENRRVPFENMVYIADGPSDIPVFSILKQFGGKTFAVYKPGSAEAFAQANELQMQGRVDGFGPADYRDSSHTAMWILHAVEDIADKIAKKREAALSSLGRPPHHITSDLKSAIEVRANDAALEPVEVAAGELQPQLKKVPHGASPQVARKVEQSVK